MSDYLSIKEVAELLRVKPKTISARIKLGVYRQGVHFFRRQGMKPLFKRQAVIDWVEGKDAPDDQTQSQLLSIKMSSGYNLGS